MPEVRLLPSRQRTTAFAGPLPTREHRKIALSVEGEAASLTAAEEGTFLRANREAASMGLVEKPEPFWLEDSGIGGLR